MKSRRERRLALAELELKDRDVREKGLRDRFGAREYHLHVLCFYEGEYTPKIIEEELEKVHRYVEDVRALI